MAIRVYSWEDVGAPTFPSVSSQRFIDNLRILLKACLVDGYGEKPAAGWTLPHDVADGFSLNNGDGNVTFVATSDNRSAALYLIEAITDPSTPLPAGSNRRSGSWTDGFSTTSRHHLYCPNFQGTVSSQAPKWVVVADEKTFIVNVLAGSSTQQIVDPISGASFSLYAGLYHNANGEPSFMVAGGRDSPSTNSQSFFATRSNLSLATVQRNPFTNSADQGTDPVYRLGTTTVRDTTSMVDYPLKPLGKAPAARVPIYGLGNTLTGGGSVPWYQTAGFLRGLLCAPDLSGTYLGKVLPALGVASPTAADRYKPITVGSGQWIPLFTHSSDMGLFISLDPMDWAPL